MQVYLTTLVPGESNLLPHFRWDNITFGDYADSRVVEYDITFPPVRLLHFLVLFPIFLTDTRDSLSLIMGLCSRIFS